MHGDVAQPARPALERYLRRALALLRWVTLAVLLAIVVTQPSVGYRRLPMWALVTVSLGSAEVPESCSFRTLGSIAFLPLSRLGVVKSAENARIYAPHLKAFRQ